MLRRMVEKHPNTFDEVQQITNIYQQARHPGTTNQHDAYNHTTPAPQPGHKARTKRKQGHNPKGPIGLLLCTAHLLGAHITDSLQFQMPHEQPIGILTTAWNHLNTLLEHNATRARYTTVTHNRSLYKDAQSEIDTNTLHKCINACHSDNRDWLVNTLNLGRWTPTKLADFVPEEDGKCKLCGAADADINHILWQCTTLDHERYNGDEELRKLNPMQLPPNLRLGLPGMIHAEDDVYLWPTSGYPDLPDFAMASTKLHLHPQARSILAKRTTEQLQLNARQLIHLHRAEAANTPMPMPPPCHLPPPDKPNVYTDGALKNPAWQCWSLGGMGVWWPQRELLHHPLNQLEADYMSSRQEDTGVSLWGAVTGAECSSTRAELAGGCVAIAANQPIHQATDSQAYKNKANRILNGEDLTFRRPWGLQKDGDLWKLFHDLAHAKGLSSIHITWVKGHAKQHHIDQGLLTADDADGNDKADTLASLGINEHMDGLQHLANYYRAKQIVLQKLTTRIHNMFHRVLTKEHELRTAMEIQAEKDRKQADKTAKPTTTLPHKHPAPPTEEGQQLNLGKLTTDKPDAQATKRQCQVKAFLENTTWKHTTLGHNGTSWTELFALYQCLGGNAETEPSTTELATTTSLNKQLATFTRDVKAMAATLMQPHDRMLFNAARNKNKRLENYGITNHIPCINAHICLDNHMNTTLHEALAHITKDLNTKTTKLLHNGALQVTNQKLRKGRPPPWPNTGQRLEVIAEAYAKWKESLATESSATNEEASTTSVETLSLQCATCRMPTSIRHKPLTGLTWKQTACSKCRSTKKASNWLCLCGELWHHCQQHRDLVFALPIKPESITKDTTTTPGKTMALGSIIDKRI